MASTTFAQLPAQASIQAEPFNINIPEEKVELMKKLVSLSPIGPPTYENTTKDEDYGVGRSWLDQAKQAWETEFDWRKYEKHLNSFPHFTANVHDDTGVPFTVHFVALFSRRADAVPMAMYHGWPGSFLEHLDVLKLLQERYTPETLPYHVVVPSLTGFMFSSGPPVGNDFDIKRQAGIMDALMIGLFGRGGYLAHGGDLGQSVALCQAALFDTCKGIHVNNVLMAAPENSEELLVSRVEKSVIDNRKQFMSTGIGYAMVHATKPATIGLAMSASPLSLLAWIGEKYLAWTDTDPPLERILEAVSLYYLTDTFPRSIWNYRNFIKNGPTKWPYISKPVGYSFFPRDLAPVPLSWFKTFANVIWHREHGSGGHFPGLEAPATLLADIEDFVSAAWKST